MTVLFALPRDETGCWTSEGVGAGERSGGRERRRGGRLRRSGTGADRSSVGNGEAAAATAAGGVGEAGAGASELRDMTAAPSANANTIDPHATATRNPTEGPTPSKRLNRCRRLRAVVSVPDMRSRSRAA